MTHVDTYLSHFKPQIAQLSQIIKDNQSFLLIGHKNPDGDCIGSLLGFGRRLENMGKELYYVTPTGYKESYERVSDIGKINYVEDNPELVLPATDVKVFLDLSSEVMIEGGKREILSQVSKVTVCIDHHLNSSLGVDLMFDDTSSSSCCELLWELMGHIDGSMLDEQIANYCYMGLVTDTGGSLSNGLAYEKDTIRSFENVINMKQHGLDKKYVLTQLGRITLAKLQFANLLLRRIKTYGNILRSRYKEEELKEVGNGGGAGLGLDLMRNVEGFPIVIRFCFYDDGVSCSLRTSYPYDVQVVAQHYGGGGHKYASGFKLEGSAYKLSHLDSVVKKIAKMIQVQE